jgi:hypothetical protein
MKIFFHLLKYFFRNTQYSIKNSTLLIMDDRSSHTSLSSYNFCTDNGIFVVSIPLHNSHNVQPLDVSFLTPYISSQLGMWMPQEESSSV